MVLIHYTSHRSAVFLLAYLCLSLSIAFCQNHSIQSEASLPAEVTDPPSLRLQYQNPKPIPLLTNNMSIALPFLCGSDGSITFPALSFSSADQNPSFSAYTIKTDNLLSLVSFDPNLAGLKNLSPSSFIAQSSSTLVIYASALTTDEALNHPNLKPHPFLLFFRGNGQFQKAVPLNLPFQVGGLALFESGNVLVISSTVFDAKQHWVIVNDSGEIERTLSPSRDDMTDISPEGKDFFKALNAAKGRVQIIPWRRHLLIAEVNSRHPLVELNEHGVLKSIPLQLPDNQSIFQIIPSDGDTWTVMLTGSTSDTPPGDGLPPGAISISKVAEFSTDSGVLLRYLRATDKNHYAISLACRFDQDFYSISTDPKDGHMQMEVASPERE